MTKFCLTDSQNSWEILDSWESLNITKGLLVNEYQNWGKLYTVELEITVTNRGDGYSNIFHFIADGDSIPALGIRSNGLFVISSSINGNGNYGKEINFELDKKYQMIIKQCEANGAYWFETIVDGESNIKIENKQPQSFSSVKFYASNPTNPAFLGSISNVKIQQGCIDNVTISK